MTVTAITVTPHGRAVAIELSRQEQDYLGEIATRIACERDAIDSITLDYPPDVFMIWFRPNIAPDNEWATRLSGQVIHGTVVFTGSRTAPGRDLTALSPRCMNTIHEELRRLGSPPSPPRVPAAERPGR